jgi:hypothetical protein
VGAVTPYQTRKRLAAVCRQQCLPVKRARPHPARPRPGRVAVSLTSMGNSLAAVLRIKALWRLHCCALPVLCWGGAGASANSRNLPIDAKSSAEAQINDDFLSRYCPFSAPP